MDYRYGSHTVYQIEYHFVWVAKYRYKVLSGEIAERVRDLARQTCEAFDLLCGKLKFDYSLLLHIEPKLSLFFMAPEKYKVYAIISTLRNNKHAKKEAAMILEFTEMCLGKQAKIVEYRHLGNKNFIF